MPYSGCCSLCTTGFTSTATPLQPAGDNSGNSVDSISTDIALPDGMINWFADGLPSDGSIQQFNSEPPTVMPTVTPPVGYDATTTCTSTSAEPEQQTSPLWSDATIEFAKCMFNDLA